MDRRAFVLAAGAALSSACAVKYGFTGGGLPADIKTVAVLPFENETATPELQRELTEEMRKAFRSRLGLREATEEKASIVVKGVIARYELDEAVGFSANPTQATSARRRLTVVVNVEILDQIRNKTLWKDGAVTMQGEYAENAEAEGRKQAVDRIVNKVIEGAQSQW
jgi:hypothetical protein